MAQCPKSIINMTSIIRTVPTQTTLRHLVACLSVGALYACAPAAQACGDAGATCSATEPATQPSGAGNVGAGNPINVITGNKYQREIDMAPLPGVLGLEIVRHYNSALSGPQARPGALGRGWRLSYESALYLTATGVQIDQPDGSKVLFGKDLGSHNVLLPRDPSQGKLEIIKSSRGDEYLWTWADGRKLRFNHLGKLEQIQAPTGEVLSMQYDARGLLLRVTDPQGRSLQLGWLDAETAKRGDRFRGVQTIDSPLGRFTYAYGSPAPKGVTVAPISLLANLVKVSYPTAGAGRRYHYESAQHPTLMTGISIDGPDASGKPASLRYATFGYRTDGRTILSTHANDVDKVTLDYTSADTTTVTNSLGQKTTYRFRSFYNEDRLLEVRGAGCSLCGEPNVRYGYDNLGRLTSTTKLATDGTPLKAMLTELDRYSRPLKISRVAYVSGKAQSPQWLQRYEYAPGSAPFPVLIARPSVVPGREYVTRIAYERLRDATSLPVRISERGFAPTLDGKDASYAIERSVSYRYNVYGERIETDGPLANAAHASPDNSDITLADYDRKTKLLSKMVAPGGMVTEVLERDAALRPSKMRTSDGDSVQTTTITYNLRGQPEAIDVEAMLIRKGAPDPDTRLTRALRYRYDLMGNLASVTLPGNLTTRFVYDASGRLAQRINPDGSRVATVQDSEGRLVSEGRYLDADTTPSKALQVAHYHYDAANRLAQVDDAAGVRSRTDYTPLGQIALFTNALGSSIRFDYDANGLPVARTQQTQGVDAASVTLGYDSHGQKTAVTDANGVKTERRYDDFGRKVVEVNPDRGMTVYQYDVSGRLLARADESHSVARYRYDHANRLVAAGSDKDVDLVQYHYRGMRRSEIVTTSDGKREHATEVVGYAFDAFGQVTEETRWMARVDGASTADLTFVTHNTYDAAGRLTAQRLPDGHTLNWRYRDNGTGQLDAILFDELPVVSGIQQTQIGGLTGYVNGNGIRQQISLDGRGRIRELEALGRQAPATLWQRVLAWFGKPVETSGATIYRQTNVYDAADRLTDISRQKADPANPGRAFAARAEHYGYDGLDRLTQMPGADGTMTTLSYDRGGNRISETGAGASTASPAAVDYRYAPGSNRLVAVTQAAAAPKAIPTLADATRQAERVWFYHDTGVPLAQLAFTAQGLSQGSKRIVYNAARRPVAVYDARDELVARYHYNGMGERIAKTVYPNRPANGVTKVALRAEPAGVTTYSLYADRRLAMEADADGHIRAHYIYLGGRPVAKIETTSAGSFVRVAWNKVSGGAATQARIYAIHTDHLGAPQVVTDEQQHVIWQADTEAFGRAQVRYAANVDGAHPFEMNLRLPGQVYDRETELHYNYLRDYDPALGRYTTPDPLGIAGGMNPYAYVSANPLTNIDPLGLYQLDMHYYMVFFLGLASGLSTDDARTIALASQYVDDNPVTSPIVVDANGELDLYASVTQNQERLATYHFMKDRLGNGTDIHDEHTGQLSYLRGAVDKAPDCAKRVFFGEFLHAFADTYSHADEDDDPYSGVKLGLGAGHGLNDSDPDYTFNHNGFNAIINKIAGNWQPGPIFGTHWKTNEARTLEAEKGIFKKITDQTMWKRTNGTTFANIEDALKNFNATGESEQYDFAFDSSKQQVSRTKHTETNHNSISSINQDFSKKLAILNAELQKLHIDVDLTDAKWGYDVATGKTNRDKALGDLNQNCYENTILPNRNTDVACPNP